MPKLSYLTKDNINPKNRGKIYLCHHPEDKNFCLTEISEDIWDLGNYAIFYDGDPYENDHSFYSDLDEIHLCLMIVTRRFLTEESIAKSQIFPYFKSHNIPILPILIDSGIDRMFESTLGDIQYIYRGRGGSSITPYKEKLEKYLSLIFIGDDKIKRIQMAFDAYIFLSYRKTDKQFAKRLMSMIHDIYFCRDVAIWYDEFLTPGESFNDNIADAIKSCKLFTMAVTPNIVAKGNYVMEKEYPMAKENGKAILPVEFLPTDRRELSESFYDIPGCVNHSDSQYFARAVVEILQSLAFRKSEDNPIHNYLIGLAYLEGIDVEVNKDRALQMIIYSAKAGYVEAIETLVNMFRTGHGVIKNYDVASYWQNKLIEILEKKCCIGEDKYDSSVAPDYIKALLTQGEIYTDQQKYNEALPFVKKARKVANDLSLIKGPDTEKFDFMLSDCSLTLAEIYMKVGMEFRAMLCIFESFVYMEFPDKIFDEGDDRNRFFRKLISFILLISDEPDISKDEKLLGNLGMVTERAEEIYRSTGLEYDLEQYLKCLLLSAKSCAEKDKRDESSELSRKVISLLSHYTDDELPEELIPIKCKAYYQLTVNINHGKDSCLESENEVAAMFALATHAESNEGRAALAEAYTLLYNIHMEKGERDAGKECLLRAKEISLYLSEITGYEGNYVNLIGVDYLLSIFPKSLRDDEDGSLTLNLLIYSRDRIKELKNKYPKNKAFNKAYNEAVGYVAAYKAGMFLSGLGKKNKKK